MKKIFLFCAAAVSLLSSCSLDEFEQGSISDEEAIETLQDCERFRAGLYGNFRAITSSSALLYPEIQADKFQALALLYGNNVGDIFKGSFTSATTDFEGLWYSVYSVIANVNYYLPYVNGLIENQAEVYSPEQILALRRSRGDAHFMRAYYYYQLYDHYCQTYSEDKKDTPALGLPLVKDYDPTFDRSKYPGRSTMAETFKFIYDDLTQAEADYSAYEEYDDSYLVAGAPYMNTMAIKAFRARLALLQGNKADAVKYAQEVIDCGLYELAGVGEYASVWIDDNPCKEVIVQPFMNEAEAQNCNKYGTTWTQTNRTAAWYVPSNETINMYAARDVRGDIFFEMNDLAMDGTNIPTICFVKYPGNAAYANNTMAIGCNAPKPFRISEMYLIVAECAGESEANEALNTLRRARIRLWRDATYSGDELVEQVREERAKELIGEGFRLSDLRRWGIGFTRDNSTPTPNFIMDDYNIRYFVAGAQSLSYQPGDYRYVWPIPASEIQVNPQMTGQQNPGY